MFNKNKIITKCSDRFKQHIDRLLHKSSMLIVYILLLVAYWLGINENPGLVVVHKVIARRCFYISIMKIDFFPIFSPGSR